MGPSPYLFCAGRDETFSFLEAVLGEVCDLFPSRYIHLGGDEAPKEIWAECPDCQAEKRRLGLADEHALQIHFMNRLADIVLARGRVPVCWGDVVTTPGPALRPETVIHWWNYRGHGDAGLREAMARGHAVIGNTNYYSYINFPHRREWRTYKLNRVFDLQTCYEKNPCDLQDPSPEEARAILGMGAALWTDWGLTEEFIEPRMFPRLFALAEQMWHCGPRLPSSDFEALVDAVAPVLARLGVDGDWEQTI